MYRLIRQALTASLLLLTAVAMAHDLHQSTGEAEYDAATKKLEVSLTFFSPDLELALIRFSERQISLHDPMPARADAVIKDYLKQAFVIKASKGTPAAMTWVGREFEPAASPLDEERVTVYFEVALPSGLEGLGLTHTALHSCFADQMNLLSLRVGGMKTELRFTKANPTKTLLP